MSNNQFSFGGWEKCNFLSSENTFKTLAFLNKHFSLKCSCVFLLFLKKFFFEFYFTFLYSRSLLVINLFFFNPSSILYTSVYTCQSQSPNSSHHHPHPTAVFPPWCPYVCSLHLCLNFCPANQFICTIFLGSTYMC